MGGGFLPQVTVISALAACIFEGLGGMLETGVGGLIQGQGSAADDYLEGFGWGCLQGLAGWGGPKAPPMRSPAFSSGWREAQLPTVAGTTRTLNLLTLAGIYGLFGGVVGSWVQLAREGAFYDHPFLRGWGLAGACAAVGRVAVHRLLRGTGLPAGKLG